VRRSEGEMEQERDGSRALAPANMRMEVRAILGVEL